MSKKTILNQGDISYELGGGLGSWAKSKERKVLDIGDTRVIGGILMSVYMADYGFLINKYDWTPVDKELCYDFKRLTEWMNGSFL